jgi:hypothetical protein
MSSEWIDIKKTGLPEEVVLTAARRGELLVSDLGGDLFVERAELRRWLQIKTMARTASRNDINPKAAHPESTDRLQRSAADSALEGAADDALRDQHFRKGLPVQVNKRWLSYVDGSGGEYAARVRFRDNTSFLVQLHTKRANAHVQIAQAQQDGEGCHASRAYGDCTDCLRPLSNRKGLFDHGAKLRPSHGGQWSVIST